MVEQISRYKGLAEIIIIDNNSDYEPLLDWYDQSWYKIIQLNKNFGHKVPWIPYINSLIQTDLYVVTDPDLDLSGTPDDTLLFLYECLSYHPECGKIGLGLEINDIPPDSLFFIDNAWEKELWERPEQGEFKLRAAPIDTTFALYSKSLMNSYHICGARTTYPYVAKHLPWYLTEITGEYDYYMKTANSSSSSKMLYEKNLKK